MCTHVFIIKCVLELNNVIAAFEVRMDLISIFFLVSVLVKPCPWA